MAKKDIYEITVKNWKKYNGGMKSGHKMSLIANNFCYDAKLRAVPVTVRWMFLGIVLICGDHTRDTVELSESQLRDLLESSWSIARALSALEELQLLTVGTKRALKRIEKKIKEKKIKESIAHPAAERLRFEELYEKYPKKVGKSRGLAKLEARIKTPEELAALKKALERFLEHLRAEGREPRYIPHFSTWVNNWQDWLDPSHGASEDFSKNGSLWNKINLEGEPGEVNHDDTFF